MLSDYFYLTSVIALLFFLIYTSFYTLSLCVSLLKGAPFVKTKKNDVLKIIKHVNFNKGLVVYDLGCGDGYFLRFIVKKYKCHGVGIDINPILIFRAKLLSLLNGVYHLITFKYSSINDADIREADIIYIFLLPALLSKIRDKLKYELKPGAIIISHGFKLNIANNWLIEKIEDKKLPTYIYQKPIIL